MADSAVVTLHILFFYLFFNCCLNSISGSSLSERSDAVLIMAGNFQHPFQCLQLIERQSTGSQDLLIASAGPSVYSYAAGSGQRLAIWPQNIESVNKENLKTEPESTSENQPPEKRRKVSPARNEESEDSKSTGQVQVTWSTVPLLVPSSDGKYVVALTGEDKTIRVLKVEEDGTLQQLSAR